VPLLDKVPVKKNLSSTALLQSAELKGQETWWQNGYFKRKKLIFDAKQIIITGPNIRKFHKCDSPP